MLTERLGDGRFSEAIDHAARLPVASSDRRGRSTADGNVEVLDLVVRLGRYAARVRANDGLGGCLPEPLRRWLIYCWTRARGAALDWRLACGRPRLLGHPTAPANALVTNWLRLTPSRSAL
jgi:hypothetical protein